MAKGLQQKIREGVTMTLFTKKDDACACVCAGDANSCALAEISLRNATCSCALRSARENAAQRDARVTVPSSNVVSCRFLNAIMQVSYIHNKYWDREILGQRKRREKREDYTSLWWERESKISCEINPLMLFPLLSSKQVNSYHTLNGNNCKLVHGIIESTVNSSFLIFP